MADLINGEVPVGWAFTTLGAICERGGGGIQTGPFGSQLHASDYVPVGIPSVMPVNIGDNRIVEDGIMRITEADATRLSRHRLQVGDIVYSRRGDVERRALVREPQAGWLCGTGCLKVRLGKGIADPLFASLYLGHPAVRQWIVQHAVGATMPNLNTEIMSAIPFALPPLAEQKRLAHILGTLDDKIELNRRMNATLEAMSRVIFKSWFVDFDPVRQKTAGQQPVGMDAQTAALFPDSFDDSEIGEVPKGWTVQPISELAEIAGGSTPSTREPQFWDGGVHRWATPKDLSNLQVPVLLETERRLTVSGVAQITSGLLPIGTVLLSSRAPIGYLAIAEAPVAINQGFIAMKPADGVSHLFLLRWTAASHDEIVSRANGSTFLEISKSNFRPIPVVRPTQAVMDAFHERAFPLFRRVVACERESRSLAALRDTLLPKLLSGEIRVPQAEEAIEETIA
jgi:type I restriction enzyme S subunit